MPKAGVTFFSNSTDKVKSLIMNSYLTLRKMFVSQDVCLRKEEGHFKFGKRLEDIGKVIPTYCSKDSERS